MGVGASGRPVRLIHTSDLHLGCDYLGDLPRQALRRVVDVALAAEADALLLAGDLFDHNRVPDLEVAGFVDELARFPRASVVLPGNHDCYDGASVYRRATFTARPARIRLLDGADDPLALPEHDLAFWGRPVVEHCREFRPLLGAPASWPTRWRVVLGHGQFEQPDARDPRSSPIFPDDIAAAGCDYVALGHWDVHADVSQAGVAAFYSGAPHHGDRRKGLAEVVAVTLDPTSGIRIDRLPLT